MLFVEVFRFLFVLIGAVTGQEIGHHVDSPHHGPIVGMLLGAGILYVLGGIVGRLLDQKLLRSVFLFRNIPPGEIFAASITATTGILFGLVIGMPLFILLHSDIDFLFIAVLCWVQGTLGWRIGAAKGRQVVAAAGLSRIFSPPVDPPPEYALLVDTSAMMDRFILVLGRAGLLPGGLVIPQFVIDEVRTLADGPDPVTSRRARRGLESIEVLREVGVSVHIAPYEIPEVDDPAIKMLKVAKRLGLRIGTCSSQLVELAGDWELSSVDLRRVAGEFTPDHPPGERLIIDLLKGGRQPRQAVGFLPDGDMVVVNDALHRVGTRRVDVTVSSTRSTNQGLMIFAYLTDAGDVGDDIAPTALADAADHRPGPIERDPAV